MGFGVSNKSVMFPQLGLSKETTDIESDLKVKSRNFLGDRKNHSVSMTPQTNLASRKYSFQPATSRPSESNQKSTIEEMMRETMSNKNRNGEDELRAKTLNH